MQQRRLLTFIALVVISGAAVVLVQQLQTAAPAELLKLARSSLDREQFTEAERLALLVPRDAPESAWALLAASEAAAGLGRYDDALNYYARVPEDCGTVSLTAFRAAVAVAMEGGRVSVAERYLRNIRTCRPDDPAPTRRLARLLRMQGRRWESRPLFFELLKIGRFDVEELVLLGDLPLNVDIPPGFVDGNQQHPGDSMTMLWQATGARFRHQRTQAESLLRQVIAAVPDQIEAHAQLGLVLLEQENISALSEWHAGLPVNADQHPEIWYVRGMWCERRKSPDTAIRCLAEAVDLDPNHVAASYQLTQILLSQGSHAAAQPIMDRVRLLQLLENSLFVLDQNPHDTARMQQAAQLTEALGRVWESWGWCGVALRRNPPPAWAQRDTHRLRPLLQQNPPLVLATSSPLIALDRNDYPLPDWKSFSSATVLEDVSAVPQYHAVFEDLAESTGLVFQYVNGGNVPAGTLKMFEFTGGGIAVLDFDADGWPDIYLTQGSPSPPGQMELKFAEPTAVLPTSISDQVFRNSGRGKFLDVTAVTGVAPGGFGQGVAAGDFDNDGFADLYVNNIGRNLFYRNNGDGTFAELTDQTATGDDAWSTSCVLADLNGDGLPDLYVVNYLQGEDIFERICRIREKDPEGGICPPAMFDAAQDRCYLNLGDGRFQDVTEASGFQAANGKGLGIVAFASEAVAGSGLNLFVANDAVANFYFVNQNPTRGGELRFSERALASGLALNQDGRAEACMGIATADVDLDGRTDFFVTNFYQESNTLYVQQPGGSFLDATRQSGLSPVSVPFLGFGTQFLDSDLDGYPDLIVVNGHVDNYESAGIPYKMRPQYFHNQRDGRFAESPAADIGPWFQIPCLGRSVARLDWNRDGREDFIVSSLDIPVALVTNRTPDVGNYLAIQLRGVVSARDAVGTWIHVTAGGSTRAYQLTAGDGYQASNQRQLVIGLGSTDSVDRLQVRWPSGLEQTIFGPPVNQEILLIEGVDAAFPVPPAAQ